MEIRENTSTIADIKAHLVSVSAQFVPKLSSYIDIDEYSEKLFERAQRLEVWNRGQLVGLLAYYCNEEEKVAFISNISIVPELMGGGLASEMIKLLISDNRSKVDTIRLEVNVNNRRAQRFYLKNGFTVQSKNGCCSMIMEHRIIADR